MKALTLLTLGVALCGAALGQKTMHPKNAVQSAPKAAASQILDKNLITNGGAESGDGSGWTSSEALKTITYGEFGGGPGPQSPGPTDRGEKYFYASTSSSQPTADFRQTIDVSRAAMEIDTGQTTCSFSGWFGVGNGSYSAGRLKVTFLDGSGRDIGRQLATGEIDASNRPADETMIEQTAGGDVPAGTRKIQITLAFKIFEVKEGEQDGIAFADNLSLMLTTRKEK